MKKEREIVGEKYRNGLGEIIMPRVAAVKQGDGR